MSYTEIRAALHDLLKVVQPRIAVVLAYEPAQLHDFPTLYTIFSDAELSLLPGLTRFEYRFIARLCFRWQDNEGAELEIEPYINAIPAAFDPHLMLDGVLKSGQARVTGMSGVFVSIGGTVYRAVDYTINVIDKPKRVSGI